jgi:small membrane protein
MKPIQYILILLLLGGVVRYFRAFRSKLFHRLVVLALFVLGAGLVLLPDSATDFANLLGVGRGADLVTYLALLMFGYLWLLFYSRIRFLERKHTELVRALAIENAHRVEQSRQLSRLDHVRKAG